MNGAWVQGSAGGADADRVRFDYLAVGSADGPATIRFNRRLTVLSGMGVAQRAEMFELLAGSLTGTSADVHDARCVDASGNSIRLVRTGGKVRYVDEQGQEAPSPLTLLGLDADGVRQLMLVGAADVGVVRAMPSENEPPELQDARAVLALIEAELSDALGVNAKVDALHREAVSLEQQIRRGTEGVAKRRYARLLADLERVRAEAASVRGGSMMADADRRFMAAAGEVHVLSDAWWTTRSALDEQQARFGGRERLDAAAVTEALTTPDEVPPELESLAAAADAAEVTRSEINQHLSALVAAHLPEPSNPAIPRLAGGDQDSTWRAAHHVIETAEQLEQTSIALGGMSTEGIAPSVATELETAHEGLSQAQRRVDDRLLPGSGAMLAGVLIVVGGLVTSSVLIPLGVIVVLAAGWWAVGGPRRSLIAARATEEGALTRAGVATYIGFQLRRVEAIINPRATQPLERAALKYRQAVSAWQELAGDLSPSAALELEDEVRAYAITLAGLRGAADQIALVRHRLVTEAEPAVQEARRRLLATCAPFGIEDTNQALDLVRRRARTASHARLQQELERSETIELGTRTKLESGLGDLGFSGGDIPSRIEAFDHARTEAHRRELAREQARPAKEVETELERLESQARSDHQPEWGSDVTSADGDEPNMEDLRRDHSAAVAAHTEGRRTVPDLGRLTDRRHAVARRVAVLEERPGADPVADIEAADLEQLLMARMTSARRVGPRGETVPLVLDEPFEHIHGDRKWSILEAVERLSASVQLTYLTDDVDTIVWARRRAGVGAISLFEPVA
jgi:hypothetical protein